MDPRVIGERLRRLREARGLSLRDLGATVRLAPSFLSDVERGRTRPSLESLDAVAAALGVALHDLFAPDDAQADGGILPTDVRRPLPVDVRRTLREAGTAVTYGGRPLGREERANLVRILDAALALRDSRLPDSREEPLDVVALAAHMEGEYGRPPSPELLDLIRNVIREVREEHRAGRRAKAADGAPGASAAQGAPGVSEASAAPPAPRASGAPAEDR